ncbi:hypothetical protein Dda_0597 [Drechslerella dactyloides]|uniref:Uncharacterized protein n=1 Tax=Drechslerella dactyloides TaxID=74499 RepID=A0AAD6J807_DREDA|nr:hypothetical protein Dda_0597 [Drechslerella dactyloides]
MASNNSRPGSRASTPRHFLDAEGAGIRDRASMISDIESINGDDYHSLSRTNSFFSADSSLHNRLSRHQSSPSGTIRGAPPLPLSPPPIPALLEPSNLSSPVPPSYGSEESTPHGRMYPAQHRLTIDSLHLERQSSTPSSPSTLELARRSFPSSEGESMHDELQIGRAISTDADSSQASPSDSTGPASLFSASETLPLIPPKIPTKGPPLHILTNPRPLSTQMNPRPLSTQTNPRPLSAQTLGSHATTEVRGRQESNQTASSYAMFSPTNRGSQGSWPDEKAAMGAEPPTPLRFPPHAVEAMRSNAHRPPAHFFHGPPPLHGADTSPPRYDGREANPPRLVPNGRQQPRSWSEKMFWLDPTDDDPSKPWWKRRKSKTFQIILWLVAFILIVLAIVGIVVGREIKQRKQRNNWWSASNSTGGPPPRSVLGLWTYTTNLTSATTSCAPTVNNASSDLWRCLPYENPPVFNSVWNFIITQQSNITVNNGTEETEQLVISSGNNPYDVTFANTPLNLLRSVNATYYQFTFNYTKTSNVTINGKGATCEFPNSIFTGALYLKRGRRGWRQPGPDNGINRGEWPGKVVINEEKVSGGRQVVCRNNSTMDVVPLNPVTLANGEGEVAIMTATTTTTTTYDV